MKPALAFLLLAGACAADPTPSAAIKSVTPEQLTPADDALDDLTITLRYDDGDGDLGGGVADVYDCRADGVMIELAIPAIAADAGQHITGALDLHVNDIGDVAPTALPQACARLGVVPLAAGTAVFCVVLVDAAGHRGDGDCTAPIAIME
ncbi:MAG: hypothetical protein E6J90_11745 [Deltaproteobacteria bacterium]|nr:MAG: hypothetical protein E6J91_45255 [Deltaproteobacteria bacterium]TMQ22840.1 MAG: hypothetical protein E6J90_11745 [Deltaproteobacteria bacterium]